MSERSAFHLDCSKVIPDCGFNCARCIEEMKAVFVQTPGISGFCREGKGVVVEHEAAIISARQLMDVFKSLPSFYSGSFVPTLVQS